MIYHTDLKRRLAALETEVEEIKMEMMGQVEHIVPFGERFYVGWDYDNLCLKGDCPKGFEYVICTITKNGLDIAEDAGDALDGIAHDEEGRVKVVGYVNVGDLLKRVKEGMKGNYDDDIMVTLPRLEGLIYELAG